MKTAKLLINAFTSLALVVPQAAFAQNSVPPSHEEQTLSDISSKVAAMRSAGARPRIVVFWASYGFGHLSAAKAIQNDVQAAYPNAEVILKDIMEFRPEWRQKVDGWVYDKITKYQPNLFDKMFKDYMQKGAEIENVGDLPLAKMQHPQDMLKFARENRASMVISVFNHGTEALIHLRNQGHLTDIPIAQVLTDYVPTDYFRRLGERIELSFVPHKAIADSWIKAGFPAHKVRASGIPVGKSIFEDFPKAQADEFLIQRGLDPKIPVVLLVSGSAGVGNFPVIVNSIIQENRNVQVVVVTAKNKGHFETVSKIVPPTETTIKVLGLVPNDEMIKYMKASSVLVTKTGGLTASEVIAMGKPTVFLDINGGQESYNSDFMKSTGMGLATKNQQEVGSLVRDLLSNDVLRQNMIRKQNESQTTIDRTSVLNWIIDVFHKKMIRDVEAASGKPYAQVVAEKQQQQKAYFMSDKEEVAQARWDLMKKETKEVFAAYLLFDGNKAGRAALAGALEARRRGARVRLIVDGFQLPAWVDALIDTATMAALLREGVEVRLYNPVNTRNPMTYLKPGTWSRLHDKLLYLGDQGVLFTGDRNTQNINFGLQKTKGQSGKSYVSIETIVKGSVINEAKLHLEDLWKHSSPPDLSHLTEEQIVRARQKLERMSDAMEKIALPETDWLSKLAPVDSIDFVSDHPKQKGKEFPLDSEIISAINSAKEKIDIISPYILLPSEVLQAVQAAIARGVKVRVLTASKDNTDAKIASMVFRYQSTQLEKMGVQVLQVIGRDFLHAKALRVDDDYALVTGHNFNRRSRETDLESGVVIRGTDYASKVDQFIENVTKNAVNYDSAPSKGVVSMCKRTAINFVLKMPVVGRQL